MPDGSYFHRMVRSLRQRIIGKEVTVYPTYGYREHGDTGDWLVPVRIWVHDNRDTPFVERLLEGWAIRHFEEDLGRPLDDAEKARLRLVLAPFIADDKTNEGATLVFADDPEQEPFHLAQRTTPNGVLEESVRVPDAKARALRAADDDGWLRVVVTVDGGEGVGEGAVRFLEPEGLSVVSDIDDTIKVTGVPAGKETVLRNTFLEPFRAASGMRERYLALGAETGLPDVAFHYVSGSPWQLYGLLGAFLVGEAGFPPGTFHMKNLRLNLMEPGALSSIRAFALGGDLATLDQKVKQITNLMIHLPRRKFVLVGDSGEKDPEVYRAIRELFPDRVLRIWIRDVLGARLEGMERIEGPDVPVALDTTALVAEMRALVARAGEAAPGSPEL